MATLQRTLGLRDVTLLLIGNVIGSGIFLTPGAVLTAVGGRPALALGVWAGAGLLSLLGALTYAELTARMPKAGGLYVFIRDAFGRLPAFLFGWTMFFAVVSGTVATLAAAFAQYLGEFVALGDWGGRLVAAGVVTVITAINVFSTRRSADVLNTSTVIKAAVLVVLAGGLIVLGGQSVAAPATSTAGAASFSLFTALGVAMVSVLWSYEGWQYVTFSAGEVIDAQRTVPRALLIGTLVLIAVYVLTNVGYLAALGADGVMGSERVAADALTAIGLPVLAKLIAIPILISVFSCANATLLSGTRIFFAMAQDRLFFQKMADVHPRFGTPALAVAGAGAWAVVLTLSGTFNQLLAYVIFSGWLFYALAAASLFVFRRRRTGEDAAYRTPGYPVVPIVFLLMTAALTVSTIVEDPRTAMYGLLVVATGLPAYFLWQRRAASGAAEA